MEKIKFTNEQQQAIDERNKNILVSAAAGSGKTAVLVERILSIITDPKLNINIDRFLVVTFTRAAADEMREKINSAINKRLESDTDNVRLANQLLLLNKANITTIDSFCMSIVKQNFHLTELDPNFKILTSSEISYIVNDVIESLFEEKYQNNNSDFLKLVEYFCNGGDRNHSNKLDDYKLVNHIKEINKLANADPYPDKWLDMAVDMYNVKGETNILNTPWGVLIQSELEKDLKRFEMAISNLKNFAIIPENFCNAAVNRLLPFYEEMLSEFKESFESNFDLFIENVNKEIKIPRLSKSSADKISVENKKTLKKLNEDINKIYNDLKAASTLNENYLSEIWQLYDIVKSLIDLTKEFSSRLFEEKTKQQVFEHSDIEHFALNILIDEKGMPSKTAIELQNKFYEIIVDEYQDNNYLQEAILAAVSKESQGAFNRFMVGDIKQSIYKFRLAKPEIFIDKYENYGKDNTNALIKLNKNFRSRQCIIDFVNYIFKQVMCKEFGDLNYDESVELKYGAKFPETDKNVSDNVELYLIKPLKTANTDIDISELSNLSMETEIVANRIQEIVLEKKEPKIFDSKLNDYRDPEYRDIVVLLRNDSKAAPEFLNTFSMYGIPATSPKSTNIFSTIEVRTLISILKIIDNPLQDIDLITVLHCPAYNFSGDDLAKIKFCTKQTLFYNNLIEYSEKNNDELSERIKKFLNDLDKLQHLVNTVPVSLLIDKALEVTDYINYIRTHGIKRQENLRILKEIALSSEENSQNGLFDYLEKIKDMINSQNDGCNEAVLAVENNVQIMSVHASKGLEFPIVFISQLNKTFSNDTFDVLRHSDFGIAPIYVDPETRTTCKSFPYKIFKQYMTEENISEELRVLYVALTRAKEKLILTGIMDKEIHHYETFCNNKSTNFGLFYKNITAKSFLKIIMHALMRNKEVLKADRTVFPSNNSEINDYKLNCLVKIVEITDIIHHRINNTIDDISLLTVLSSIDLKTDYSGHKQEIYNNLSWLYPERNIQDLPSKISISEIKKASYIDENSHEMYEEKLFKLPEFILEEKEGISAANRGTAYHALMEFLDFNYKSEYDVDKLKQELIKDKKLSVKEAESIDNKKIIKFLNSPINQRLRKAKAVYREMPFVMGMHPYDIYKIEEYKKAPSCILVNGIIDLFFEEDNGNIILVDYKTDYVPNGNYNIIMERYGIQLKLYKDAIERGIGKKVTETYLYLFGIDMAVKYDF